MNEQPYRGFVCHGCGKHITGHNYSPKKCHDCGGRFIDATPDRLACDRCGAADAGSVLGPTDHKRLCDSCIEAVNRDLRGWEESNGD